MLGWLLFYLIAFLLYQSKKKKLITFVYPICYFIFVGFRYYIGTDYPLLLPSIERSYKPFSDIAANFTGYNLLDLEAVYKIYATIMCELGLRIEYIYVFIAGTEALIMHYILRTCKKTRLFLWYFVCLGSLTFAHNASRQGLCLYFLILAIYLSLQNKKIQTILSTILAICCHYGTAAVAVIPFLKPKYFKYFLLVIPAIYYLSQLLDSSMLDARYGGAVNIYDFGIGYRIWINGFLLVYSSYKMIGRKWNSQENYFLYMMMVGCYIIHPIVRLLSFYNYVIAFSTLFAFDKINHNAKQYQWALVFPAICFLFEWFDIIRTPFISGAGIWFPYSNWLFSF